MRFLPSDKYNVAWFKLAECVSRGERERALGVYRLLAHSFDDTAFSRQLEGDILLAFDDIAGALDRYHEAVVLYQQSQRILEAAAICEHLIVLDPQKQEYITMLAEFYGELNIAVKAATYTHMACALALAQNDLPQMAGLLEQLERYASVEETIGMRQQLLWAYMRLTPLAHEPGIQQMKKIIDGLIQGEDQKRLQQFMMSLEEQSTAYFNAANAHMSGE